jgi:hypothetical protein
MFDASFQASTHLAQLIVFARCCVVVGVWNNGTSVGKLVLWLRIELKDNDKDDAFVHMLLKYEVEFHGHVHHGFS